MSHIKPDIQASLDFLQKWEPGGPWVLTCIDPNRKKIVTKTFDGDSRNDLRNWLEQWNNERNIYFHVNPTTRPLTKKAVREDIAALKWLHIDIDPRPREDIEQEKTRALGLLTSNLPSDIPPPTAIVYSGGGYQGFWRLTEPFAVDGDLDKAEHAKRWNQKLEILFDGDNCHNIDRIMRLPGTINIPDERKVQKGRVPVLAELVEFNENAYPLSNFTPLEEPKVGGGAGGTTREKIDVDVGEDVEYFDDVNRLDEWDVPDRVKVAIVQGTHPDEPKEGDNSRSAWLFDVVCNLVRSEVPDPVIFSVITNPEFGISESVLGYGTNARKYALRQIERGKEEAESSELAELNARYAVIENYGGKCLVMEQVEVPGLKNSNGLPRYSPSFMSLENFCKVHENRTVIVGSLKSGEPKTMELGKWWRKHPQRRQYHQVVFHPEGEVDNAYNLWEGFSAQAIKGDCSLYLEHMLENICDGNEDHYNYILNWMARTVQEPASPGQTAIVLRGGQGTGKSLFAEMFGRMFGNHFLPVSQSNHLVGNFNSHLRNVLVLFADEAFFAGDKKHTSVLKTLITEGTLAIEAKGVDVMTCPNHVHLIMASNEDHVVPAGSDERRYLVLDVAPHKQQDSAWFGRLVDQMEKNGGLDALLHLLLNRDISGFNVRDVPKTRALADQKMASLTPEQEWWYQKLQDGFINLNGGGEWQNELAKSEVEIDFAQYFRRFNKRGSSGSQLLGNTIKDLCPDALRDKRRMIEHDFSDALGQVYRKKARVPVFVFPSLERCRELWEQKFANQGQWDWPSHEPELDLEPVDDNEPPF